MHVAREVVDDINRLLDGSRLRLFHVDQIRESAGSISANIREAYGRRKGRDRDQFFRFARASAEETDERIRSNFAARRIADRIYWRIHNRLSVIVKMLNRLLGE